VIKHPVGPKHGSKRIEPATHLCPHGLHPVCPHGWTNVLITNPRDFRARWADQTVSFAFISGVNTLFNAWMNRPGFAKLDFSHLKMTLAGGMAYRRRVAQRLEADDGSAHTGWD